eukprot:COSAG05_NODE_1799_length_4068_cov_5.997480_2_plen_1048_part_01
MRGAGALVVATLVSLCPQAAAQAPTLDTVTIASNADTATKAKVGSIVTLSMTASADIVQPTCTFKIGGATVSRAATIAGSAKTWTCKLTVQSGDPNGDVGWTIVFKNADDEGGTKTGTAGTNNAKVTVDKTAPAKTVLSYTSSNVVNTLAKAGDTVTVLFESGEKLQKPTCAATSNDGTALKATESVTANDGAAGKKWKCTFQISAGDKDGAVKFTITFKDEAGNSATATQAAKTTGGIVTLDVTGPTASSGKTIKSNNAVDTLAKAGDKVTIAFTTSEKVGRTNADEPVCAVKSGGQAVNGAKTVTAKDASKTKWECSYTVAGGDKDGTITFEITFKDDAGNAQSAIFKETGLTAVTVDLTQPDVKVTNNAKELVMASNNAGGYTKGAKAGDVVTIKFTTTEKINTPTCVVKIGASNTDAKNAEVVGAQGNDATGTKWQCAVTVKADDAQGAVKFSIEYKDLVANAEKAALTEAAVVGDGVVVDTVQPNLAAGDSKLTFKSNNPHETTLATTKNTVTISFEFGEAVQTPKCAVKSDVASKSFADSKAVKNSPQVASADTNKGLKWTCSYAVDAADNDGPVKFEIKYDDLVSNAHKVVLTEKLSSAKIPSIVTIDQTPPQKKTLKFFSSNAYQQGAKQNDVITIEFESNEAIQKPTSCIIKVGQNAANAKDTEAVAVDGNDNTKTKWTCKISVKGGNDKDAEGDVEFLWSYKDLAGNDAAAALDESKISGTGVYMDQVKPKFDVASLASNNQNTLMAKEGDVITLTLGSDEVIQKPTACKISSAGTEVKNTVAIAGANKAWTCKYTVHKDDKDGDVTFSVAFKDLVSNEGVTHTKNTGDSLQVDKKVPTWEITTDSCALADAAKCKTNPSQNEKSEGSSSKDTITFMFKLTDEAATNNALPTGFLTTATQTPKQGELSLAMITRTNCFNPKLALAQKVEKVSNTKQTVTHTLTCTGNVGAGLTTLDVAKSTIKPNTQLSNLGITANTAVGTKISLHDKDNNNLCDAAGTYTVKKIDATANTIELKEALITYKGTCSGATASTREACLA